MEQKIQESLWEAIKKLKSKQYMHLQKSIIERLMEITEFQVAHISIENNKIIA